MGIFLKQDMFAVIPAYNEEKHIAEVLEKTKKQLRPDRIIVVDDGSRDRTCSEAKTAGATVIRHAVNLGKGAAMKTGCDYAIKKGAEAIVLMDSDGQHDPKDIPRFANALIEADMAFGYRKHGKSMPLVLKIGNLLIDTAIKILFQINIKDTQSGYRAFTTETYKKIRWTASDYSAESEMIALSGKHKIRFVQIPIETIYLDRYKGTGVLDGVSIVTKMAWWKLTR